MEYALLVGLVVFGLLLVAGALVLYQLILQHGHVLLRLDEVEERLSRVLDPYPVPDYLACLPAGVPAPAIDLPDLNGNPRVLAEWRGRRVLLVFCDPHCAFSWQLLPSLVALASDPVPDRPTPLIVSTGDADENRSLFDGAGYSGPVLLQRGMEVAAAYKVDATPVSYLIDADGMIAQEVAVGVQETLILAGEMASVTDVTDTVHREGAPDTTRPDGAGILRTGLMVGSTAPIFRLPRLEGGELSLLSYRGRQVLLVFLDPDCEACDRLWPVLGELRQDNSTPAILAISRGEIEANKAMVSAHGLECEIALQRHWEISREYGIFAVPSAFHIDEWGVIATEVAAGQEEVLGLIGRVACEQGREANAGFG